MPYKPGNNGNLMLKSEAGTTMTPQQLIKQQIDDQTVVEKVLKLNDFGTQEYRDAWDMQELCHRFRNNKQWNDEELRLFTNAKRIPLQFNVLRTFTWHLQGLQRMSRATVNIEGVDRGIDPALAEIAYKLIRHAAYITGQDETDSLVFSDGLDFMGIWHIYWDQFKGINGRIAIERCEPGAVLFDPNCQDTELEDCKWVRRLNYMRPEEIKRRYPHLDLEFTDYEWEEWYNTLGESYQKLIISPYQTLVDRKNNLYALMDVYERMKQRYFKIVDGNGNDFGEYTEPVQTSGEWMLRNPGYYVIAAEKSVMQRSCIMPYMNTNLGVTVEDYEYYPYVPFISGYLGNRLQENRSYVDGLIDPQREINIRRSNQIEYIQRDLRGGGFVKDDAKLTEDLNKEGSHVTKWYNIKNGQIPEKIPATFPAEGLKYLEETAGRYLEMTSGISTQAYGGVETSNESGIHRKLRREESQITVFPILEMFNKQRALVAKAVLERMVKNQEPGDVIKIIGEDNKTAEYMQLTTQVLQNLKSVSEWDIRTSEGPYQTEMQQEQYNLKMELFQIINQITPGVIMPGDLIRGSGLPDEQKLAAEVDARYLAMIAPPAPGAGSSVPGDGSAQAGANGGVTANNGANNNQNNLNG